MFEEFTASALETAAISLILVVTSRKAFKNESGVVFATMSGSVYKTILFIFIFSYSLLFFLIFPQK